MSAEKENRQQRAKPKVQITNAVEPPKEFQFEAPKPVVTVEGFTPYNTVGFDAAPNEPKIKLQDGKIFADTKTLDNTEWDILANFVKKFRSGELEKSRLWWYFDDRPREETEAYCKQAEEALAARVESSPPPSANHDLDALNVQLPTRTIAERSLIKDALRQQIARLPTLMVKDNRGNTITLDPQNAEKVIDYLDFVFIEEDGEQKMLIGCKTGIQNLTMPALTPRKPGAPLSDDEKKQFTIDESDENYPKVTDRKRLRINLKNALDGKEPFVGAIEIVKEQFTNGLIAHLDDETTNIRTGSRKRAAKKTTTAQKDPDLPVYPSSSNSTTSADSSRRSSYYTPSRSSNN